MSLRVEEKNGCSMCVERAAEAMYQPRKIYTCTYACIYISFLSRCLSSHSLPLPPPLSRIKTNHRFVSRIKPIIQIWRRYTCTRKSTNAPPTGLVSNMTCISSSLVWRRYTCTRKHTSTHTPCGQAVHLSDLMGNRDSGSPTASSSASCARNPKCQDHLLNVCVCVCVCVNAGVDMCMYEHTRTYQHKTHMLVGRQVGRQVEGMRDRGREGGSEGGREREREREKERDHPHITTRHTTRN